MKSDTAFVLESANWPVLLVDAAGAIRDSSQGAKRLFGNIIQGSRTLAQSIWSRENESTPEEFLSRWNENSENGVDLRFRGRDGSTWSYLTQVCPFPSQGENLYLLQLFRKEAPGEPHIEVQEPARTANETASTETTALMEASTAHKQKLDCAMQLIRTVALDFNNALTSVLGHASLVLGKLDPKSPVRGSLVEIEKSAQKAAEIAHDLADFSRQEKDTRGQQAGNLNDIVRRTIDLFRETHHGALQWKATLEPRPYAVPFDEAKMQQALVKILENAIQAQEGFGTIEVSTRNFDVKEGMNDGNARLNPGSYFVAEVKDTGKGIPQDVLPRIFEPFFTTKKDAGHRGLGLAWVYGIVTNHGGSVAVTSEVNKGASVRVYLPAQKRVVDDRLAETGDLTGSQTILMIDDEDLLLTMGEMVLSSFGYKVLTASSGQKALEIFAQKAKEIDLVITDLVMPRMSGRELIERLRKISPQVKVICASGFVRPPASEGDENYLQKPFASQDLLRKVKQVLQAASAKS